MGFDPKLIESNILLTNEVFKVPTRIIYASSCSAAFNTNPYAYTKIWAEYCGMRHGNAVGLRFHNVYGNGNKKGIVWHLLNQQDGANLNIRGAELVRDYIHVDDVVNAILHHMNPSPIYIDINELQKVANKYTAKQLLGMAFERNIVLGDSFKLQPSEGVVDIGTGVGTKTIDLVNLFMRLADVKFNITTSPAGLNEPEKMISNNIVKHMTIEEGLVKVISNEPTGNAD